MTCGRCGRKLSDPVSIQTGYGPICRVKMGITAETNEKSQTQDKRRRSMDAILPLDIPGQISMFDEDMKGGRSNG